MMMAQVARSLEFISLLMLAPSSLLCNAAFTI